MNRLRTLGALVVAGVVAGLVWTGVAVAAPGPCADILPLSSVSKGDIGEGWTVRQGTDPEPFDAEVLGVMPDLIAPGRDVIIVEISGPVVDTGGGVWAGMSGSPIYIGGELAGALAYGFSFGPTNIAGLTPAEDMLHVNGLPAAPRVPARLKLPRSAVRSIAAKMGAALPTMGGSLVRLKVPVSISGVSSQRYRQMRRLPFFKKYRSTMRFTAGASSSASLAGVVDDLVPGGNFSAALSYGDLTIAGVGTTTYVCDGQALAFGHPMLFTGKSSLGAGSADAIAIIADPTLTPFKFANVTNPLGTLDQDRLAGIRAVDGEPPSIPITTAVTSIDSGNSHVGETDVVFKDAFPDLAFSHITGSIDSVFDKIGSGSASYDWTIQGKREDGTPWELHKTNMYVSKGQFADLSFESAFEILGELLEIANYPNEKVEFTNLEATINVEETVHDYELQKVLYCRRGSCDPVRRIRAHPGDTLKFRAILKPSDGSPNQKVNFKLTIPPSARGGAAVTVGGGSGCNPFFGTGCSFNTPDTFDDLLASFEGQPNNVLVAQLLTGRRGTVSDEVDTVKDQVISGSAQIPVFFPGQCCPPPVGFGEEEGGGFFFFKHA
jgi:hypothetical protein